jgi:hypothetical protein
MVLPSTYYELSMSKTLYRLSFLLSFSLIFFSFLSLKKVTNAENTVFNWQQGPNPPLASGDGALFIFDNKLYYVGGWGGNSSNPSREVYFIPVIQGVPNQWAYHGQLPSGSGSFGFGVVKNNSRVYIVGGYSGSNIVDKVFSFDGVSWRAERNLPQVLNFPGVEVMSNRLYVAGGLPGPIDSVSSSQINDDGTLGEWRKEASLPLAVTPRLVGQNNCLFAVGGKDKGAVIQSEVYRSIWGIDGSISSWTSNGLPRLPEPLALTNVIVHNNIIFVFGGEIALNTYSNKVYFSNIANDCSLSSWQNTNLPNNIPRERTSIAKSKDGFYLTGGRTTGNTYLKDFWYSLFYPFPLLTKGWNNMIWINFNESQIPSNCFRFGHINNNYWNSYTKNFSIPSIFTVISNPYIYCQ